MKTKSSLLIFLLIVCKLNFSQQINNQIAQNCFIKNQGQWTDEVLYLAQTASFNAWITKTGVVYDFYQIENNITNQYDDFSDTKYIKHAHAVKFCNVNSKKNISIDEKYVKKAYHNYLIGNEPMKWQSKVAIMEEIIIKNIYDGIDQRWYFENGNLRYDYIVDKGANYKNITISIEGSHNYFINNNELFFTTRFGEVKQTGLFVYQNIGNKKNTVETAWKIENGYLSFEIKDYDKNYPLTIDPLITSTFIGGNGDDIAKSIYVDNDGYIYILGITYSNNFPVAIGAYDQTHNGFQDVFVTKMNNDMNTIIFSTYLGGDSEDEGYSFALDANKNIYITGLTSSSNFPTTAGCFDATNNSRDAFITKLNNTGTNLEYSTYIGGTDWDFGNTIVVDNQGKAYITGKTWSNNFPTTAGSYDEVYNGGVYDVYVLKLNETGTALEYSTYIGGDNTDIANAIAIDTDGNVYLAGATMSSNFPTTAGAFSNTNYGGDRDAFLTKLNATGSAIIFSTFIGGNSYDEINAIALDNDKNIYVTGRTQSSNFPTTAGVFDNSHNGSFDIFVTKFNNAGTDLVFSTYVGGGSEDIAYCIKLDQNSNIYISGTTYSSDIPVSTNAYDNSYNGNYDAYFLKLNNTANQLIYATYLGSAGSEMAHSLDIDNQGFIYLAGYTNSINFPTTPGAYNQTLNGEKDIFVSKLYICPTNFAGINVSPSNIVCQGTMITLSGTGALQYEWSGGIDNDVPFAALATATYTLTATDENGCIDNESIEITVNPLPNILISADPEIICLGSTSVLTATGASDYQWDNDLGTDAQVTVLPTQTTTYTVVGTDQNNCSNSASVEVVVNPLPNVSAIANPEIVCIGSASVLTVTGASDYQWDNDLGTDAQVTVLPTQTTTYTVVGTDQNNCTNSASVEVVVNPLPNVSAIANPEIVCIGSASVLTVTGANNYQWDNDLGTDAQVTVLPTQTTTYTVVGTDQNNCSNSASVEVVVKPMPDINIIANENILTSAQNNAAYQWVVCPNFDYITNATEQSFTVLTTGNYAVIIDIDGCIDTSECQYINVSKLESNTNKFHVNLYPNPASTTIAVDFGILQGEIKIKIIDNFGQIVSIKSFNTNIAEIDISNLTRGLYFIEIIKDGNSLGYKVFIKK